MVPMVAVKKFGFWLSKHAPEILTYGGTASMLVGTVFACKATPKGLQIIEDNKNHVKALEELNERSRQNNGQVEHIEEDGTTTMITYDEMAYKRDMALVYRDSAVELCKNYAVSGLMLLGGAAMVISGHGILSRRYVGAVTSLSGVMATFKKYRENARALYGETADRKMLYGTVEPKKIETVNAETGEVTEEITVPQKGFQGINPEDPRFLMFNKETCPDFYKGNLLMDLATLKAAQMQANDVLKIYGHIVVNQVRDFIGAKAIAEGLDNGWVMDGNGDGYVDFGVFDPVTGEPKSWVWDLVDVDQGIPIELNIDGNIKALMNRPRNSK